MNQSNDQEKIKRIRKLYAEFHAKITVLMKRQLALLEKVKRLISEKKLKEVRNKIKK